MIFSLRITTQLTYRPDCFHLYVKKIYFRILVGVISKPVNFIPKKPVKFHCTNATPHDIDLSKYKKWGNCLDAHLMVSLHLAISKLLK